MNNRKYFVDIVIKKNCLEENVWIIMNKKVN